MNHGFQQNIVQCTVLTSLNITYHDARNLPCVFS